MDFQLIQDSINYSPQACPLFVHYCSQNLLKITLSHSKSIKVLWLYSVKYSILPQIAKIHKIFSIPVRVTIAQSHRWLKIAVCGFLLFTKIAFVHCLSIIFKCAMYLPEILGFGEFF